MTRIILNKDSVFLRRPNEVYKPNLGDGRAQQLRNARLVIVYGRRRVGKTTLITHWMNAEEGHYSQAIEGSPQLQISQICQDLNPILKSQIQPKTWVQFFELLEKSIDQKTLLCLDEFPYLVESDPTLPSIMQKWLDLL